MSTYGAGIADSFDLATLTPDFFANPYPYYRALREHAPVKAMPDGSWFLTRYDDILPVYRDAEGLQFRQEEGVRAEVRTVAAARAPHDEPGVQRSAAAHARPAADPRRAVAAPHRGDGAGTGNAGRRTARRDGGQGPGRSHRGFRGVDPDRDHRQPAGRAARGARRRCAVGRWRSWARWSRCSRRSARRPATPPCAKWWPTWARWRAIAACILATRRPTCSRG